MGKAVIFASEEAGGGKSPARVHTAASDSIQWEPKFAEHPSRTPKVTSVPLC